MVPALAQRSSLQALRAGVSHAPSRALVFCGHCFIGKIGRAYIKPFYAQANDPLPGGRASQSLLGACDWWIRYIGVQPSVDVPLGPREEGILAWTDAAGVSRWVAAVVCLPGGSFVYTRCKVPEVVWSQLLPREDHQIGMQELLAVPLLLATFGDRLRG